MREFSPFRLDTVNECLWRRGNAQDDERILLTPKAFAVLGYLVEHAGRLVTQHELLSAVWPETYVQPEVLKYQIADIRSKLGDSAKNPLFIETLPRRGYRFIAVVREWEPAEPLALASPAKGRLVGRDRELGALRACLRRVLKGQRQIVFVTGEPGIGKTALVDEFDRQVAAQEPSIRIARGQCVESYGGAESYYPMLEALGQLCHGSEGNRVVEILAAQAPTWLVQFPALVTREQRQTLHQEILGATRNRMLREIQEALATIASEVPVLFVFEDLQWVDSSTIDLLSAIARRRTPSKLMLIVTKRPVDMVVPEHALKALKEDLLIHHLCQEITLAPLSKADVAEYLGAQSPGKTLPEGFAELIHRHSEGNPLFMVALLDHMTERGQISRENGKWRLRVPIEEFDLKVPETLRQMIEAQIDHLTAEEQRALEVASVAGFLFSASVVAGALKVNAERLERLFERLSRRSHIVLTAGSQQLADGNISQSFEFVHALYREVLYHRQTPARRASLHRRIGQRLEEVFSQSSREVAAEAAHHFEEGGDWPRAVKYLRLAAETAMKRFAHRDAARILDQALGLARKLPEPEHSINEIEIMEELARLDAASRRVRAFSTYEALAERAAHLGLVEVEMRARVGAAYALSWTDSQRCLEVIDRCLLLSSKQDDPMTRARTRQSCLFWRLWVGGWSFQGIEEYRTALAELLSHAGRLESAWHRIEHSFLQWCSSQYRQAYQTTSASLAILVEGSDPAHNLDLGLASWGTRLVLPWSLLFLGEWGAALEELHKGIALLENDGELYRAETLRLYRAWVHLYAMDFTGVLRLCQPEVPWAIRAGRTPPTDIPFEFPVEARISLILAGMAETGLGNYAKAYDYLSNVRQHMDRQKVIFDWYWRMPLEAALTELQLAQGDIEEAKRYAQQFLEAALATEEHTWRALAFEANARVAIAEGDLPGAQDSVARGLREMEGFEVPLSAWRVHATAAELYARHGNNDLAGHHRDLSRATILKLANSLAPDDPLRRTFLAARPVRKVLGTATAA
jgi:DNA-binding winged helix-turn-helix (wHTH) protein/tetratricopeptide (TPR) repeat protein